MKKKKIRIFPEKCKGCMLCIEVCPKKLLKVSEHVNERGMRYVVIERPEECTGCGMCYMMCPDSGIEITETDER